MWTAGNGITFVEGREDNTVTLDNSLAMNRNRPCQAISTSVFSCTPPPTHYQLLFACSSLPRGGSDIKWHHSWTSVSLLFLWTSKSSVFLWIVSGGRERVQRAQRGFCGSAAILHVLVKESVTHVDVNSPSTPSIKEENSMLCRFLWRSNTSLMLLDTAACFNNWCCSHSCKVAIFDPSLFLWSNYKTVEALLLLGI